MRVQKSVPVRFRIAEEQNITVRSCLANSHGVHYHIVVEGSAL